jgi:P27 family predicted phage terminase small subunit
MKEAEDNPGHRPLNHKEPKPGTGVPEMPRWLSKAARKEWKSIVPILLQMKVLTVADGKALASYCEAVATFEMAQAQIQKFGVTIQLFRENKEGELVCLGMKTNPAVTIADKQMQRIRAFATEFGLTPASRARLHTDDGGEPADPLAAFMQRRKPAPAVTQ